jgi:hypothetical protein
MANVKPESVATKRFEDIVKYRLFRETDINDLDMWDGRHQL